MKWDCWKDLQDVKCFLGLELSVNAPCQYTQPFSAVQQPVFKFWRSVLAESSYSRLARCEPHFYFTASTECLNWNRAWLLIPFRSVQMRGNLHSIRPRRKHCWLCSELSKWFHLPNTVSGACTCVASPLEGCISRPLFHRNFLGLPKKPFISQ